MEKDKIMNLEEYFYYQLKIMHGVESLLIEKLPRIASMVANPDLKEALRDHVQETITHREKLERIFKAAEISTSNMPEPHGIKGMVTEAEQLVGMEVEHDVQDAAVLATAQKVEHYEISSYGTLCQYAKMMEKNEDLEILKEILSEEKNTDEKLSKLAKEGINEKAASTSQPSNFFGRHG